MSSPPSPTRRAVSAWRGLLVAQYALMTAYRAELLLWALSQSMSFILMGAWYEATRRGTFSIQPVEIVRYFGAVYFIRQLTAVWVIWELEQDVQTGRFAGFLLQPVDPAWRYVAAHLSERLARLPFSVVLLAFFVAVYPPAFFVPALSNVAWCALFCGFAFAMRFLLQFTLGLFAFWTERISPVENVFFLSYMFLSGAVAPLDVFPPFARAVLMWTPFPYFIWVPARVLVPATDAGASVDLLQAVCVCVAWTAGLVVLNRFVWRRARTKHAGQGA